MKEKTLEQKYQLLDDITHILLRPERSIGSIKNEEYTGFLFNTATKKMEIRTITYNPGILKLFDEIILNSVDESKRNKNLNKIEVTIGKDFIKIFDNGGIAVQKHKEHDLWIPELIFSKLRAGSNFDDSEKRTWAGTHGEGSKLVNIFSSKFIIETADGKNKYHQVFTENNRKKTEPKITPCNDNYTEITFYPEFNRFGLKELDNDNRDKIIKRLIDICGTNSKLKFGYKVKD